LPYATVTRFARTGRTRSAWWIGILGAIAFTGLALGAVVAAAHQTIPATDGVQRSGMAFDPT
jgi:hypothetical protein